MPKEKHGYYEFFAGGGMLSLGLSDRWRPLFANDNSPKKAFSFRRNFPEAPFVLGDVADLSVRDLPGTPTLAWASFPCQDLSLAGPRKGIRASRSGTFWPFWNLIRESAAAGRTVPIVVLENVVGLLAAHGGADFLALVAALREGGYRVGPVVLDARYFVPQSRPRLFILAVSEEWAVPASLLDEGPSAPWHPDALRSAYEGLPRELRAAWLWWRLPAPPRLKQSLADLLEENPRAVAWNTPAETERLLELMTPAHRERVRQAQTRGERVVGTVYRRTRPDGNGGRTQRAEVRLDGIGGCLRTPAGGSSRQTILSVEGDRIRSRLLSPREAARLMGVSDSYILPENYNEAYRLMGDGLVVPVVRRLEENLLLPLAANERRLRLTA